MPHVVAQEKCRVPGCETGQQHTVTADGRLARVRPYCTYHLKPRFPIYGKRHIAGKGLIWVKLSGRSNLPTLPEGVEPG